MSKKYNPGKIKPIVNVVARILEKDPTLHQDHDRLLANVYVNVLELKDNTRCPNCTASMVQYEYNVDVLDIALVIAMGKYVRKGLNEAKSFTEANQVHVPTLEVSDAVRHRTTKCSKLGLVAKHRVDGKQINGTWVVIKRGFEALKGEEIPNGTIVWRGNIIDRPGTLTTFDAVRRGYSKRVSDYERKNRKAPKDDHRFAGYHEGDLF